MSARLRAIIGVVITSALLVLYFVVVGIRAVALLSSGSLIAVVMGAALLVLPIIGVWALVREIQFGRRATLLADRLEVEGLMPHDPLPELPSGRPDRSQVEAVFPKYRAEVETNEGSWQAWMRLGIVYDACGDRKRARVAIRQAIALADDEIRR